MYIPGQDLHIIEAKTWKGMAKMERPGEMLRRAGERRRLEAPRRAQECREEPLREPAAAPLSRHGSYSALMRSHDRVATRHIPRQG